jgi:hypothetical protein
VRFPPREPQDQDLSSDIISAYCGTTTRIEALRFQLVTPLGIYCVKTVFIGVRTIARRNTASVYRVEICCRAALTMLRVLGKSLFELIRLMALILIRFSSQKKHGANPIKNINFGVTPPRDASHKAKTHFFAPAPFFITTSHRQPPTTSHTSAPRYVAER